MNNITRKAKVISIFIIMFLCFSFCASLSSCNLSDDNDYKYQKTAYDYIRDQIEYRVYGIMRTNGYVSHSFTSNISSSGENRYKVTGKVTLTDEYGNKWTGNYDAVVKYRPESDDYDLSSFNLDTLYKNR